MVTFTHIHTRTPTHRNAGTHSQTQMTDTTGREHAMQGEQKVAILRWMEKSPADGHFEERDRVRSLYPPVSGKIGRERPGSGRGGGVAAVTLSSLLTH